MTDPFREMHAGTERLVRETMGDGPANVYAAEIDGRAEYEALVAMLGREGADELLDAMGVALGTPNREEGQ